MPLTVVHLNAGVILVVTMYSYVLSPSSPASWDLSFSQDLFGDNTALNKLKQPTNNRPMSEVKLYADRKIGRRLTH